MSGAGSFPVVSRVSNADDCATAKNELEGVTPVMGVKGVVWIDLVDLGRAVQVARSKPVLKERMVSALEAIR